VARCINDHKARNIKIDFQKFLTLRNFFCEFLKREESGADLLGDTTCFTFLNVSSSDFIKKSGFTGIDVTQDGADGTSELTLSSLKVNTIVSEYTAILFLFEFIFFYFQLLLTFFFWLLSFIGFFRGVLLCIQLFSRPLEFLFLLF
jgi:hypothetical protein